jgi:hypothetical protein
MAGIETVYNPYAKQLHYKAPVGGLRIHGVTWRNKTKLFKEFPPASQSYVLLKYYKRDERPFLSILSFLRAKNRMTILHWITNIILLVPKLIVSKLKGQKLFNEFEKDSAHNL